jgi:hypothetical protein
VKRGLVEYKLYDLFEHYIKTFLQKLQIGIQYNGYQFRLTGRKKSVIKTFNVGHLSYSNQTQNSKLVITVTNHYLNQ